MSWILYGFGLTVVIIFAIMYLYPSLFYPIVKVTNADVFDLSSQMTVLDKATANSFEKDTEATIQGIFYMNPLQRTPTALRCGVPGYPNCGSGRFNQCECGTDPTCADCGRNGYIPILQIGTTCFLEVLPAPDAGRQGKATVQLAIRTKSDSHFTMEFFVLPPLDLQRWTMITIAREGRRFHIYYNNALVLSQKTNYMIAETGDEKGVVCGNDGLNGKGTFFTLYHNLQTGTDVSSVYSQLTDTRGVPYVTWSSVKNGPYKFTMPSLCPTGDCIQKPCIRPSQPWLEWDSQYA